MVIYAGTTGGIDRIPIERVAEWEKSFLEYIHAEQEALWQELTDAGKMTDEIEEKLKTVLAEFEKRFLKD